MNYANHSARIWRERMAKHDAEKVRRDAEAKARDEETAKKLRSRYPLDPNRPAKSFPYRMSPRPRR